MNIGPLFAGGDGPAEATRPARQGALNLAFRRSAPSSRQPRVQLTCGGLMSAMTIQGNEFPKKGNQFPISLGEIGPNWARALKSRYPDRHRAKIIARDFNVDPRTVTNWLSDSAPAMQHFARAVQLHGQQFIDDVLGGVSGVAA